MMLVKFVHPDNVVTVFNEQGVMLWIDAPEGRMLEGEDKYPSLVGIWDDDAKDTQYWEDIAPLIKAGRYQLPDRPYLHNGQVIEEGLIVQMMVEGE